MASKVRLCKGHNAPLLKCVGDVIETEFYNSWSNFSDGKVPYCKKCLQKIFEYYKNETNSEKTAAYFTLMKIDTPLIEEIFDSVVNKKGSFNLSTYMAELQKRDSNKDIWQDFSGTDVELKDIKLPQEMERVIDPSSRKRHLFPHQHPSKRGMGTICRYQEQHFFLPYRWIFDLSFAVSRI